MIQSCTTFATCVGSIVAFVDKNVIPLLYALAFLFFLFGVLRYFFTESDEGRANGRTFIIWSLVGIVVIFSVWGIVNVLISVIQVH